MIADDPLVGVDLDEANTSVWNAPGPWSLPKKWVRMRTRRSPAGRNDGRRNVRDPELGDCSHVRDTASRPCWIPASTTPTAIVAADVIGQHLRHGVPVACPQVHRKAFVTWLAAFSSRGAGRLS